MSYVKFVPISNLAVMAIILLCTASYLIRHPKSQRAQGLLTVVCFTFLMKFVRDAILIGLCRVCHVRYDLYIYQIDSLFGEPSFVVGRILEHHPWLMSMSLAVYDLPYTAFLILAVLYYLTQSRSSIREMMRTVLICLIPATFEYLILPVSGPVYAFPHFPNLAPPVQNAHILALQAPPNAIPSIHFAFALLLWYFARRWKAGFVIGALFVSFTVLATLGLGEHYFFDLLLSIPHAALSIYFGATRSAPQPREQMPKLHLVGVS